MQEDSKVGKTDPYEIFSLKKKYLIDYEELETKYFQLQNIFHPDKFVNSTNEEKEISVIESSNINNAYNLLANNVDRIKNFDKVKRVKNKVRFRKNLF